MYACAYLCACLCVCVRVIKSITCQYHIQSVLLSLIWLRLIQNTSVQTCRSTAMSKLISQAINNNFDPNTVLYSRVFLKLKKKRSCKRFYYDVNAEAWFVSIFLRLNIWSLTQCLICDSWRCHSVKLTYAYIYRFQYVLYPTRRNGNIEYKSFMVEIVSDFF